MSFLLSVLNKTIMPSFINTECHKEAHYAEFILNNALVPYSFNGYHSTQHNKKHASLRIMALDTAMLSVIHAECHKQAHYVECR